MSLPDELRRRCFEIADGVFSPATPVSPLMAIALFQSAVRAAEAAWDHATELVCAECGKDHEIDPYCKTAGDRCWWITRAEYLRREEGR